MSKSVANEPAFPLPRQSLVPPGHSAPPEPQATALARRENPGVIENTWDAIEEALRPLVQDDAGAQEVASAFYDVAWVPVSSSYSSYSEAFGQPGCFTATWRSAGAMVARLRGCSETYMDWCYEAESEVVSDRVRSAMAALGLRPVT